jgi:uncharacterized protein
MSNTFVADPRDVAKSGDVVKVKVLSIDIPRHRISLTMRLQDEGDASAGGGRPSRGDRSSSPRTAGADSGGSRPAPRQGDRQGGAKRDPRSGGQGNDGRGGAGGDRRGGPGGDRRGTPGDRRGGGQGADNRGAGGDRRGAGNSGDRRGEGGQGGDRRNAPQAPANGAMAEALRRAGLVNDKGTQTGKQDRRSNRP